MGSLHIRLFALTAGLTLSIGGCTQPASEDSARDRQLEEGAPQQSKDPIVAVAQRAEDLSVLVSALQAAGLVETLSGPGPYTLLAPTNRAFAALPQGALPLLLAPPNRVRLRITMGQHVLRGEMPSAGLLTRLGEVGEEGIELTTLSNGKLTVRLVDGLIVLRDQNGTEANVVTTDVDAANGVVHIIDNVLMAGAAPVPASTGNSQGEQTKEPVGSGGSGG